MFRTVLDQDGRFAIKLPSAWKYVYVRTEAGLWKKLFLDGEPIVVPSGTPSGESSFNYIAWGTSLSAGLGNWQDLKIAYGDVNENNSLKRTVGPGSDLSEMDARLGAQVRVYVPSNDMTTFNYNHLHDLNRDGVISNIDWSVLLTSAPSSTQMNGAE